MLPPACLCPVPQWAGDREQEQLRLTKGRNVDQCYAYKHSSLAVISKLEDSPSPLFCYPTDLLAIQMCINVTALVSLYYRCHGNVCKGYFCCSCVQFNFFTSRPTNNKKPEIRLLINAASFSALAWVTLVKKLGRHCVLKTASVSSAALKSAAVPLDVLRNSRRNILRNICLFCGT